MSVDFEHWRARCGNDGVDVYRAADGERACLPPGTPVVAPASVEELQECLRFAAAAGLHVLPAGSTEHLHPAPRPARVDVVLSTRRLAGLVEYEPADFTLIAQAGATLHAIAAATAPARQRLGPQPWPGIAATIGGAAAANRNGLGRLGRGAWRDAVLGCRVVHVDGTSTKSGGRVVKNVSGFDLAKLYIGSLGTLAILTEVNLRLVPVPEASVVVRASAALGEAHERLLAAHRGALRPEALVVALGGDSGAPAAATLWARFEGRERVVAAQAQACAALWHGEVLPGAAAASQWQALERFDTPRSGHVHLECATLPVGVVDALATVQQCGGADVDAVGLFGVGTFHVRVPEASASCLPEMLTRLAALGAAPRWCVAPPELALELPRATAPALQAALKAVFDPQQRLPTPEALREEAGA